MKLDARWLWVFGGLLGGVLLLIIGLKVPTDQVSGYFDTTSLHLEYASDFDTDDLRASNIGVRFSGRLKLPDGREINSQSISLKIGDPGTPMQDVTSVPSFLVKGAGQLEMSIDETSHRAKFEWPTLDTSIRILPPVNAKIYVDADECVPAARCEFTVSDSRPLVVQVNSRAPTTITFDIPTDGMSAATLIPASALDFTTVIDQHGMVQRRSGVVSGVVKFLSLPDAAFEVLPGEIIVFAPDHLLIRSLRVTPTGLKTQFSGVVRKATVQIGASSHSIMPSWFQRLAGNPYVRIAAGIASMLLGAAIGVWVEWLKKVST